MSVGSVAWIERQRRLLRMEYEFEKARFKAQTEIVGVERKVRQGLCWFPVVSGASYYNSLNRLVLEVRRSGDAGRDHLFEPGRQVCFFGMDCSGERAGGVGGGMLHYFGFTSTVSFVDGDRMVLVIPEGGVLEQLRRCERLGVQLALDETTYRLMFDALDRVSGANSGRLSVLRNIFHGDGVPEKLNLAPIRFPWLNTTQEEAVNEVLRAKDVMVVHGPPGTGKTTTLVEAIYETLRRETQVLVCAQSNMAVDWISEKLCDRGISVLRVGNPKRVDDKMLSFTYERRFEAHASYPTLWAVRKAVRDVYARRSKENVDAFHQKVGRLRDRAVELEMAINDSLFSEARVVACTLAGSGSHVLSGRKFSTLFIDEAAQALEAACWIAMAKAGRVVLAGDHCQLPPTVKCREALEGGLGCTLMETFVKRHPKNVSLLRVQYRMNEAIMRFSADYFYGGMVESALQVRWRGILDLDVPMEWVDTSAEVQQATYADDLMQYDAATFAEMEEPGGTSRLNPEEARLTLNVLRDYFLKIGRERVLGECMDVGVISPYKGQVYLLRGLLKRDEFFKPFRRLLTVDTVDGFQGQERDVVVVSLVRGNERGDIGFLHDLRRMNVAMTRARMKLILVGHSKTLCRTPFYKHLYEYVRMLHG